jgi:hypothetical protein
MERQPSTDAQAFHSVRENLRREVGAIFEYVEKQNPPVHIYWAFLRMLFPVAESIGDLAYRSSPSANLLRILREEYIALNPNYGKVAALLIYIYRHSLIHSDALREIDFEDTKITWALIPNWLTSGHLDLMGKASYDTTDPNNIKGSFLISIKFSVKQFYEDTLEVCNRMYNTSRKFNGDAGKQYDNWRTLHLERKVKNTNIETEAMTEIVDIMNRSSQ